MLIFWVIGGVTAACGAYYCSLWRQLARAEFIRSYSFPRGLLDKLHAKRPATPAAVAEVETDPPSRR